jgi:hypothetical protein
MRDHRITKPEFPPCSTCWSHSQAPLCLYTRRLISKQPEGTLGRLRYILGGDRPSQTTHVTLSLAPCGAEVRISDHEEWYFTVGSTRPGGRASKPPTYPTHHGPKSNARLQLRCRGLSVQRQVTGVFTGTTISPSPSLRQRSSRYAFRAGRNLPDKEFRYLRTVIVTAAVYWGFGSQLRLAANRSP